MFALAQRTGMPPYPMAFAFSYEFDKHICCPRVLFVLFLFLFFLLHCLSVPEFDSV